MNSEKVFNDRIQGKERKMNLVCFFYVLLAYNLITLLLYYVAPLSYEGFIKSMFPLILVLFYLFFLWMGFLAAARFYYVQKIALLNSKYKIYIFFILITLSALISMISGGVLNRLVLLFSGYDVGYIYNLSLMHNAGGNFHNYYNLIFGYLVYPSLFVLIVLSLTLKAGQRVFAIFLLTLFTIVELSKGINKFIFDFIWMVPLAALTVLVKLRLKTILKIGVITGVLFVTALVYFTEGMLSREGSTAITGYNSVTGLTYNQYGQEGGLLTGVAAFTSYLTQGYYAIDRAKDLEYIPTYGLGNSTFLYRNVDAFFNLEIRERTYIKRLESIGWDELNSWSSFYLWWASDLTFYGVPFLMFIIGFLSRLIINSISLNNLGFNGVIGLYFCFSTLIYLPANNQVLQSGSGFIGFFCFIIALALSSKIYFSKKMEY